MCKLSFSSEDQKRLQKSLKRISERMHQERTLDLLLSEWAVFVAEVETGYDFYIEDYTNDLSIREVLEEIRSSLTEDGQSKLDILIEPADKRFLAATRGVDRPLLPSVSDEPPSFWWYRIPKRLEKDLEQDLRKEGFL